MIKVDLRASGGQGKRHFEARASWKVGWAAREGASARVAAKDGSAEYQKVKNERADFEKQMIEIAKKEGLIFDQNKIDTKFYPYLVKSIFEEKGDADHLFALKLALFEVDDIRDSDNMEQKTAIRKSKTKIDAIQAALNCLGN